MTFRFKIFAAIVLVMIMIISLLTLNLWLEWYNRLRAERQAAGELLARTAQDWIPLVFTAPTPTAAEQIEILVKQLRRSTLFEEWVIVDGRCTPLAASHPGLMPVPADSVEDLEEALSTGRLVVQKNQVSAPLLLADGQKVAISMNLQRGLLAPVDPARQFSAVLVIMGMGTALLILTMYILLNRFVVRPLERLVTASGYVEAGDYTKEIPVGSRYDEIERLNRAFNQMMRSIRDYSTIMEQRIAEATERVKRTERGLIATQRLSAMGTLAAGIAHEINNPLGGMLNAAMALQKPTISPERREEYLNLMIDGLTRIERTVKKILGFTPHKVDLQPVDLGSVVEKALALDEHRQKKKRISVVNRARAGTSRPAGQLMGDPSELQQAVFNIIKNAVDAMGDDGRGSIEIDLETVGEEIVLSVADSGMGMDEQEVSHAFDLFYTTKPQGEGTGLGLSVAHQIISSHGGRIEIESKKGVGTRVKLILPTRASGAPKDDRTL